MGVIRRGIGIIAFVGVTGLVSPLIPGAAALPAHAGPPGAVSADAGWPVVAPTATVSATGLARVYAVSKSGRYVVGDTGYGSRVQLRDLKKGKRLKLFPLAARSFSISDSGRYVAFTKGSRIKVYDRKKRRTRVMTKTRSGKRLRPAWSASGEPADEDYAISDHPQLAGGQISGNGRYVVFCANYKVPDRIDLYVKYRASKKLKRINGACGYDYDPGPGTERINPPSISENGRTILLPGYTSTNEAGGATWGPSQMVRHRKRLVTIGSLFPTMTHDGLTLSLRGAYEGTHDPGATGPGWQELPVSWYDVRTGVAVPADPPSLQLTMQNASRHGRYVTYQASVPGSGFTTVIADRTLGVIYDMGPALASAGVAYAGSGPMLSGSGRVLFVNTQYSDAEALVLHWQAP